MSRSSDEHESRSAPTTPSCKLVECMCVGGGVSTRCKQLAHNMRRSTIVSVEASGTYVPTTVLVSRADVWGEGTSGHYCYCTEECSHVQDIR